MPESIIKFGNPASLVCRWCDAAKVTVRGALLCRKCDGPDHAAATWKVV